ncbi:MAG: hypothetical protein JWO98_5325 [Frankiales bacterium]|nr:hypothetical protein [Frankiales bacterium]
MSLDNRHLSAMPFWANPRLRTVADPEGGGGNDDDDESNDDDDDSDDDEDDPDADKTDEEIRAELKSTRDALKGANGVSKKRRIALKAKEAELIEARKPKAVTTDPKTEIDVDAIKSEATREAMAIADTRAKKSEVRGALRAAGIKPERIAKLVGMVNLDDLDVDDDEVTGVDDAVDELKREWPELFGVVKTKRRPVAGGGDRDGDRETASKKSASQLQAERLAGKR